MIALSPHHKLYVDDSSTIASGNANASKPTEAQQVFDSALAHAFKEHSGRGLLFLDQAVDNRAEEPGLSYWKNFSRLHIARFAATPELEKHDLASNPVQLELSEEDLSDLLARVPPMKGVEYLNRECLIHLWKEIGTALLEAIKDYGKGVKNYFQDHHPSHNLLGRVCFHLAENKSSTEFPFAFLATYAHEISYEGKTQHIPLSRALQEYSSTQQKNLLLRLLSPIQKASQESAFIKEQVELGNIYHTLAWTPREAHNFLRDIPIFEKSGIAVRVPNWWKPKYRPKPQIQIKLGDKQASTMGLDALVDYSMSVVLGEEQLSQKEIQDLLQATDRLVFFKGQWVEVDQEKLGDLLSKWQSVSRSVGEGVSFADAMRLLSDTGDSDKDTAIEDEHSYTRIISGKWLTKILDEIRSPETDDKCYEILRSNLKAELRPYQNQGVAWLYRLNQMHLGGILADDMGLGKTIQVLGLLVLLHQVNKRPCRCLLVVPASLIGNWRSELSRFAPSLRYWIAHPSGDGYSLPDEPHFDIAMTTYGSLSKLTWVSEVEWATIVADEAQAIKNPNAKQTKTLKSVKGAHRLALTGTPVENRLSDLWSLFDFVAPGLLGSAKDFESLIKRKVKSGKDPYGPIRKLVGPYILRRLKTDKNVIQDLPDKTEIKSFCQLSPTQAVLYQKSVAQLEIDIKQINATDGMKRKGVILSYIMQFKQICNHPSQFIKDGSYQEVDSGKFQRLREICEVIADKQEKILIFTQFKEMTQPLSQFLKSIFGREGLILHGETIVKRRSIMVNDFQRDDGPPYFVLSLKAGGTGLNLTAASHVIHFDRWWNPAVENQATDRAFRIGQKKNVLVHKFICKGTLEDKIDSLIDSKKSMSQDLLEEGGATLLTDLGNEELLKIVALDINSAIVD